MYNEACLAFVCKSDFVKFLQEGPFSPLPMLCLSHFICIFAMPKKGYVLFILATPSCGKDNQDKVKTASLLSLML